MENNKPKRTKQPLMPKKNLNKQTKLLLKINLILLKRYKDLLLLMKNQMLRKIKNLKKLAKPLKKKKKHKLSTFKKKLSHFNLTYFHTLKERSITLWLDMFQRFLQISTQKNLRLYLNFCWTLRDFQNFSITFNLDRLEI